MSGSVKSLWAQCHLSIFKNWIIYPFYSIYKSLPRLSLTAFNINFFFKRCKVFFFFFSLCCSSLGQRSSFFHLHYLRGLSVINEESPCTWPTRSTFKMKSRSRVRMFIVALQTGNVLLPLIQKNKQKTLSLNYCSTLSTAQWRGPLLPLVPG